jgi:hypothetical protein
MIAADPLEVMERQSCQTNTPCVDVYLNDINTDRDLIDLCFGKIIEDLKLSLSISSDMNNDSNPEIKL